MFHSLAILALLPLLVSGAATNTTRSVSHSLPESYQFDPRDGWDPVIVTNLRYKYRRSPSEMTTTKYSSLNRVLRSVGRSLADLTKSITAVGKPEAVVITWYTGQDLANPSCWTNPEWAPTRYAKDNSFVAALTLDGWSEKPKCFKFIEICNSDFKCVFVRVVDTCAGCQEGSKHVDLTRAAFETLAPLDTGILDAQMREATDPSDWSVDLWGPKNT